ncbi:Serine--glyoxylate aminotransferase [Candidatus Hydrogenisulfobacillus filiaventi]|uniref:Serine--glyoxylate aminotransferase n=1 Tax=Candidatus Hydrogenisulfobacillus filiaventi TaxID=2707344 RepID=A0A6F8ZDY6_9FIRM|nr:aminotransferase class V-fold PLP-dependent enzyme [Bacillota bacterium]CAB1127977.1 Serine--glyoxylate aminotransferase [Candidatus Hydrogenisulfobacillus filiaventi]
MFHPALLLPGPTPMPPEVARALTTPMSDHRGPAFTRAREAVEARLQDLLHAHRVAVFPSSGTGALEAAVQNFFRPGDRVLSVATGVFAQRFAQAAAAFGAEVDSIGDYGRPWDQEAILARLTAADPPYAGVLLTHNETSTGILNPVAELAGRIRAALGPDRQPAILVDSISGVPSIPFDLAASGVDAVMLASQKGFMVPPGLGMVAVSEAGWARVAAADRGPRYYFDLRPFFEGHLPYTPAVALVYGLEAALELLEAEGAEARERRHYLLRDMARAFGETAGLTPRVEAAYASPTVTALKLPEGVTPAAVRSPARSFGVEVAGGMGQWNADGIRIGHVGYVSPADLMGGLAALARALGGLGRPEAAGAVKAAMDVWMQA